MSEEYLSPRANKRGAEKVTYIHSKGLPLYTYIYGQINNESAKNIYMMQKIANIDLNQIYNSNAIKILNTNSQKFDFMNLLR